MVVKNHEIHNYLDLSFIPSRNGQKDLSGEKKTLYTFQEWSRLSLDTKNSKIHALDAENSICTVSVMQCDDLECWTL